MRRTLRAVAFLMVVAALSIPACASSPGDSGRVQGARVKGVDLAGVVSNDRKILLADDDNAWTVDNADTLKGFEGRHVTVKCRMNPGQRAIRVLYVLVGETRRAANLGDSAFRR